MSVSGPVALNFQRDTVDMMINDPRRFVVPKDGQKGPAIDKSCHPAPIYAEHAQRFHGKANIFLQLSRPGGLGQTHHRKYGPNPHRDGPLAFILTLVPLSVLVRSRHVVNPPGYDRAAPFFLGGAHPTHVQSSYSTLSP